MLPTTIFGEHSLQAMKLNFMRTLVLALTAFAAVSLVVCNDGFREYDAVYIQGEMLKESAEHLYGQRQRHQQLPYGEPVTSAKNKRSPGSAPATKSVALVSLSTCVLLC